MIFTGHRWTQVNVVVCACLLLTLRTWTTMLSLRIRDNEPTSPASGGGGFGGADGGGGGKKEISPKMIYGKAGAGEAALLVAKMQDEMKALALCQTKVRAKKLPMEVVDAEYQWDRRKLTFYFVAEKRIDFRELVRELFRYVCLAAAIFLLPFPWSPFFFLPSLPRFIALRGLPIAPPSPLYIYPDLSFLVPPFELSLAYSVPFFS
ncbi:PSP1 C-terminal conserved region-domain-containing protein [Mycena rebaudengoi]|nr:PSP1 C-terminal conserved region-domain-containing protein [Mycena rebaudengoi]